MLISKYHSYLNQKTKNCFLFTLLFQITYYINSQKYFVVTCPARASRANEHYDNNIEDGRVPVGTKVIYSCPDDAFIIGGDSTQTCLANGQWSSSAVTECGYYTSKYSKYSCK